MDRIHELLEQAKTANAKRLAYFTKADEETRPLTAEELEGAKKASLEVMALKAEADRLFEDAKTASALQGMEQMAAPAPINFFGGQREIKLFGEDGPDRIKAQYPNLTGSGTKAFEGYMLGHPHEAKELLTSSQLTGGFLVPVEVYPQIIQILAQLNHIRGRASVFTTRGSLAAHAFVNTDRPTGVAEGAATSATSPTPTTISNPFGKVTLDPHIQALTFKVGKDALEDVEIPGGLENLLLQHFGRQFANYEEYLDIYGNGGPTQPLGLISANLTVGDIAGTTNDIQPDDVVGTITQLTPPYRQNACWLLPTATFQKIALWRTMEGGAGTGRYLQMWQPTFDPGKPDTMLGHPLLESVEFASDASDGDALLIFGDLSYFYIAQRSAVTIERYNELYGPDYVGYRMRMKFDAAPVDQNAFYRLNRN